MTQLTFTGKNLDVTDAIRDLITHKFEKVERHFDHITDAHITLHVENLDNIAEINVNVPGHQFHAKGASDDMYKSIDKMMSELDRQLIKHKEKIQNHRD